MDDLFGGFGGRHNPLQTVSDKPEKGVPWRAKVINGEFYVPLCQVSDLLASNDVLPAVRKGIDARVKKGPEA